MASSPEEEVEMVTKPIVMVKVVVVLTMMVMLSMTKACNGNI